MSKNKELRYRVICPLCGKAFDSRVEGKLLFVDNCLYCNDCHTKLMNTFGYKTLDDYKK